MFTVPLKNASSFTPINQTEIAPKLYEVWKSKFVKTLYQAYGKSPHFKTVVELVETVLDKQVDTIGELASYSLTVTCKYLDINTRFIPSSDQYHNNELKAQERVIDICRKESAATYINPTGGRKLYSKDAFLKEGMELLFINSHCSDYKQFNNEFMPYLSIIDIMMFNSTDEIKQLLTECDFE